MTFRMARVFMGALTAMLIVLPATLRAQDATGKIAGTVFDATGAVVAGAKVTVTHTGTQIAHQAVTHEDGTYAVASLPIGQIGRAHV